MRKARKTTPLQHVLFFSLLLFPALQGSPAAAQNVDPGNPPWITLATGGVHGIVPGEVARVAVLNFEPPDPCIVEVVLLDSNAHTVLSQTLTVEPGHANFVDFSPASAPAVALGAYNRTEFRALCRAADAESARRCSLSLEIFDAATGRTTIFTPPDPCFFLNPQPLPPG